MNPPENISAAAAAPRNVAENVRGPETAEVGLRYGELTLAELSPWIISQAQRGAPESARSALFGLTLTADTPVFLRRRNKATGELIVPATRSTFGTLPFYFIVASRQERDWIYPTYAVDNYGRRHFFALGGVSEPDIAAAIAGGSAPLVFPSEPSRQIVFDDTDRDTPLTNALIDQIQLIHYFSPITGSLPRQPAVLGGTARGIRGGARRTRNRIRGRGRRHRRTKKN